MMANRYGCKTVQVLTFETAGETVRPGLDSAKIEKIIKDSGAEDIPLFVISVAGLARSGKSFLLNFLISYIRHLLEHPGKPFKKSSQIISGVNWTRGNKTVTKGVWMWEKAFIISRRDNSKVAILLMDTQGLGDAVEAALPIVDGQIIYLSLSISTIHIHNVDKYWRIEDRRVYEICKMFGESYNPRSHDGKAPFNSLVLLIRNWTNDDKFGSRPEYFENELKDAQTNKKADEIMKGIKKSFKSINTYMFPEPSKELKTAEGSIQLEAVGEEFLTHADEFCCQLLKQEGPFKEYIKQAPLGKKFIENMKALEKRLARSDWPSIGSPADQFKDFQLSKAFSVVLDDYEKTLKSAESSESLDLCKQHLSNAAETARESFERNANESNIAIDDKLYRKYLAKLEKSIKKDTEMHLKVVEQNISRKRLAEETRMAMEKAQEAHKRAEQAKEEQASLRQEVKDLKGVVELKDESLKDLKQQYKDRDQQMKEMHASLRQDVKDLKSEMEVKNQSYKDLKQQFKDREQLKDESLKDLKQHYKDRDRVQNQNFKDLLQQLKGREQKVEKASAQERVETEKRIKDLEKQVVELQVKNTEEKREELQKRLDKLEQRNKVLEQEKQDLQNKGPVSSLLSSVFKAFK